MGEELACIPCRSPFSVALVSVDYPTNGVWASTTGCPIRGYDRLTKPEQKLVVDGSRLAIACRRGSMVGEVSQDTVPCVDLTPPYGAFHDEIHSISLDLKT